MSLNKVMLIGYVGKDPEIRYLDKSVKVATFRLATSERYRDRDGMLKEVTEWHTVSVWRALADIVEKYVRKGSQIYVEGRLRTRTWTDRNGAEKTVTEIAGDNMELLGRAAAVQEAKRPAEKPAPQVISTGTEEADDDLPF